jgi:hypothetical protein
MTQANEDAISGRLLLSNDQVEGSLAFGSNTIYYDARTRFGGSPFARGGWGGSFRLYAPRDHAIHGRYRKLGLETHHGNAGNAKERISHYLMRQSQGAIGIPYSDLWVLLNWKVNSRTSGVREHIWVPDGEFIERWFPDDDEGDFLEMDDRFVINDGGGLAGNTDGRVLYPPPSSRSDGNGANKENYRWFFGLRAKNGADGFANFIGLARMLDPSATPDSLFDQQIWDAANVEEMLRMWAVWKNIDHWDSWGQSRGKNCYFYQTPADGRFHLIAYDLELTYGGLDSFQIPANPSDSWSSGGFGEVNRLLNRPAIKRMYYAILDEMVNGPNRWFHSSRLSGFASRLAAIGMSDTGIAMPGGFIDQRAARIQTNLQSVVYPQVRMQITTNGGNAITTAASEVDIAGIAPVEVAQILVNEDLYTPRFTSMTAWAADDVALIPGVNDLTFFGIDLTGNVVDADTIRITSTAVWSAPSVSSLSPNNGAEGIDIAITGSNFRTGPKVFFGDVESPRVVFETAARVLARVPAGSGAVPVTVENRDGQSSNGVTFTYPDTPGFFLRGDANGSGVVDLSDGLRVLFYLFGGKAIDCLDAADTNDDELLNLTDAVAILDYLFQGGAAPRAPFPVPGVDPAGAALDCAAGG